MLVVFVWVGILCINQEDLQERTQQVRKMRDIFWSSQRVLAWTGEPDEDSKDVFEPLQSLSEPSVCVASFKMSERPMELAIPGSGTVSGVGDSLDEDKLLV